MKRTYVDAGVLIRAARGEESLSAPAIEILCDRDREFVSSTLVKLEVLPHAQHPSEKEFYETYFRHVTTWAPMENWVLAPALRNACASGMAPMDAIHVALARATGCEELITTEKAGAAIFSADGILVVGL